MDRAGFTPSKTGNLVYPLQQLFHRVNLEVACILFVVVISNCGSFHCPKAPRLVNILFVGTENCRSWVYLPRYARTSEGRDVHLRLVPSKSSQDSDEQSLTLQLASCSPASKLAHSSKPLPHPHSKTQRRQDTLCAPHHRHRQHGRSQCNSVLQFNQRAGLDPTQCCAARVCLSLHRSRGTPGRQVQYH